MVVAMKNALHEVETSHEFYAQAQQVHSELEKHMQYFVAQGQNQMASEIMHLQFILTNFKMSCLEMWMIFVYAAA